MSKYLIICLKVSNYQKLADAWRFEVHPCLNFGSVVLVVSWKSASKCDRMNTARCDILPELQVLNFHVDKAHSCATTKPHDDIARKIGVKVR
jgi:hypothetical protein